MNRETKIIKSEIDSDKEYWDVDDLSLSEIALKLERRFKFDISLPDYMFNLIVSAEEKINWDELARYMFDSRVAGIIRARNVVSYAKDQRAELRHQVNKDKFDKYLAKESASNRYLGDWNVDGEYTVVDSEHGDLKAGDVIRVRYGSQWTTVTFKGRVTSYCNNRLIEKVKYHEQRN